MTTQEIALALEQLGCPSEKCTAMAAQLDRRARMDAARRGVTHDSALKQLLGLMAQGWGNRDR